MFIVLVSLLATSIAMACPSDRLCPSDRIIDSQGNVGTVKKVFENGQAKVYFDGIGNYTRSTSSLGKGVDCHKHICVGDRVIDKGEYVGTVKEVFDNGRAKIFFDNFGKYIRKTQSLGKGFRCIENVCVNDRVIDKRNFTGKIKEVFDNGKAKVYLDGFGHSIRSFSALGIELNCSLRENCSYRN